MRFPPVLVLLAAFITGCSSAPASRESTSSGSGIYLHDARLERQLKDAQARLEAIDKGSESIWAASSENRVRSTELKSAAISRSGEVKLAANLTKIPFMTWADVSSHALMVEQSTATDLNHTKIKIKSTLDKIAALKASIAADPGQPSGTGSADGTEPAGALGLINANAQDLAAKVQDYLTKADEWIVKVDDDVIPKLDAYINAEQLSTLIEIYRKADHQDLIKSLELIKQEDDALLPSGLSEAIKTHLGIDITNFGQLRKTLTPEKSGIYEIRLTLLDEARKSTGQLREAQLKSLQKNLQLHNDRLAILGHVIENARKIQTQITAEGGTFQSTAVLSWLEQSKQAHAIATNPQDKIDARNSMTDKLNLLVLYTNFHGSLDMALRQNVVGIQDLEHQERIDVDRIATEAHGRLVQLGLEGTIAFAEGGVTEEQIANWLRTAQAAALSAIGVGVN